jgi:hypothetical protein
MDDTPQQSHDRHHEASYRSSRVPYKTGVLSIEYAAAFGALDRNTQLSGQHSIVRSASLMLKHRPMPVN